MAMNENTVRKMREEAEPLLDRALVLLGDLGAGQRLGLANRPAALPGSQSASWASDMAAVTADDDGVDEAGSPDELLRGGEVEQRERRPTRRGDVAVAGDADQRELARPGLGDHLDRVADLVVALVGGTRVEGDLTIVLGQPAFADRPERLVVCGDRRAEGRRPVPLGTDRLAVLADDPGEAEHAAVGVAHAWHLSHIGGQ